ncbi:MAG TPA: histidine kinase [Burkholderiaceae bacterium]
MKKLPDNDVTRAAREIGGLLRVVWWNFFDWIALLTWPHMAVFAIICMIGVGMLRLPDGFIFLVLATVAMKILAGGKRKAELAAGAANERAEVEALERRLLEAQIAVLQAQVEPHFLFNTLALIGQLIETDPPEAARIQKHLIAYLRSAMPQMREQGGSTLGRQVALSKAYLEIMQARMKERLHVVVDVPAGLAEVPFPPMMLQSVVENAIKHGLETKVEGGTVTIRSSVVDGELYVDVQDDGVGFNLSADEGTGLSNIRERLKVLYGGKARLVVEIPPGGGALVSIRMPYPLMHQP